jgi:hypothetical protein
MEYISIIKSGKTELRIRFLRCSTDLSCKMLTF